MPDKVYRTAIYCRLSREDGDKVESNSIASQRAICEDYIARHEDLELVCEPFVDDGYSGVSFNRPQFKKLEEAIRKGALDCIVVKDLSRFSRNYIDGGRYIEKIFPQLGIRFIAINDAYDSLTGDPQSDSFVIPFKNLINDSYCKDISMKIRSSLEVKQKSGEFVGSFAPYTGTNFHRPQFTQMMEKVKRGEIDLICVKDFSRFSRDYIETGNYLECTFPFMGVRFISINDGYDSDDYKGTTGGLEVVMRSIIYAAYSKDLSVKTTSAKIQMMKQGKYVGGYAPYGYVLHPTIRNKLAVDPEAADVIRRIFREALEGSNTSRIARSLNDEGIPTPGQYFKSKHPDKKKFSNMSEKISWETVMVYNILKNLVYTGTLVSRKMKSCGVGSKKRVVNEPIIVEGTHEAIISKEDFELAQKVIRGGGRNPTRKQHDYPLKGLVRCGNCKRAMTRRKNKAGIRYFQCIHSVNNGNTDCPVGRSFPEMDIEKVVFHALTQFLALAQKEAIQNREVGDLRKSAIKECADKIRTLQKQNEQHKASKLRLYEKYAAGSITKEAYIQQKAAADVKIAENDGAIQRSHERMKELDSETACSDEKLDAVCEQYADCKALTYELTHAFISAVYIYDLDNIEIVWKVKDFLTTSEGETK